MSPRRDYLWVVGKGIGSQLVKALLVKASNMKLSTLYFGTDGPGLYTRFDPRVHEDVRPRFSVMRFELQNRQPCGVLAQSALPVGR